MDRDFYRGEVLLIDKPLRWTSFQAVNKIRHAIRRHPSLVVEGQRVKPKVGHAGTLDPLATGLLIVCTGKQTKNIQTFMGLEKEYTGSFLLGATTPCFDLEKEVDQVYPTEHITEEMVRETARTFLGVQQQTPPVFSAVMVGGRRAYDLARAGEPVEIRPREIEIREFEITAIGLPRVDFRIVCSKGTYIRSIARDFGQALRSGAHLTALCRTRIGPYHLAGAPTPEAFADEIRQATENQDRS